jgi:cell division protein FtsN
MPWRVLLVGGALGLAAVIFWAYQTDVIHLEQWTPGTSQSADLGAAPGVGAYTEPPAATPSGVTSDAAEAMRSGDASDASGASAMTGRTDRVGAAPAPVAADVATTTTTAAENTPSTGASAAAGNAQVGEDRGAADGAETAVVPRTTVPADHPYCVHVSSYRSTGRAESDRDRFIAAGYTSRIVKTEIPGKGTWYRVYVGHYATLAEAREAAAAILAEKLSDFAQARRFPRSSDS